MDKIDHTHAEARWQCIDCGYENVTGTDSCSVCGSPKQINCLNCRSLIDAGTIVCPTCGIDITKYSSAYEHLTANFVLEVDADREKWKQSQDERVEREIASSYANAKRRTVQALVLFGVLFVILMTLFVVRQIREQEKQAMLSREYEAAANCLGEHDYNCARDHLRYVLSVEPDYRDASELLEVVYNDWIGEATRQGDIGLVISLLAERTFWD